MPGEGENERIGRIQYLVSLEGHESRSSTRKRIVGNVKDIMLPSLLYFTDQQAHRHGMQDGPALAGLAVEATPRSASRELGYCKRAAAVGLGAETVERSEAQSFELEQGQEPEQGGVRERFASVVAVEAEVSDADRRQYWQYWVPHKALDR